MVPQVLVLGFVPMAFALVVEVLWTRTPELAWISKKTIHCQVGRVPLPASDLSESERLTKESVQIANRLVRRIFGGKIFWGKFGERVLLPKT